MFKFTNWQLVAIVAIMFAAIICARMFAPGDAPTVLGMVSALFGTLFLGKKEDQVATPAGDK